MQLRRGFGWLTALCVLTLITAVLEPVAAARAQPPELQAILDAMTPEERVGQLFLVSVQGTDVSPDSHIYELIANHHVGGVVLLAESNNFVEEPDTLASAQQLIGALQSIEREATERATQPTRNVYIPLFIGIS